MLLFDAPPGATNVIAQVGLLTGRILLAMSLVQALRSIVPERGTNDARA